MKIVNVIGGLGNQMFQYAFAFALKKRNINEDIFVDISHFNGYVIQKNGYELERIFPNTTIVSASCWDICKVSWFLPYYFLSRFAHKYFPKRKSEYYEPKDFVYDPHALEQNGDKYFDGYWQSAKYFDEYRDDLLHEFMFDISDDENLILAKKMKVLNSVGIHIRRGDYVNNTTFGSVCTLDYYERGIKAIIQSVVSPKFYIFSNGKDWCEENIIPLLSGYDVELVDINSGTTSFCDMFLMTQCQNLIIANSSFSWWAAYLNQNKGIIIAPKKWTSLDYEDNVPLEEWMLI